jgi:hypothetical protein
MEPVMSIETKTKPDFKKSYSSKDLKQKPKVSNSKGSKTPTKEPAPVLPLYAYTSFELTSLKSSAAIIKISQRIGDQTNLICFSALFSNNNKVINSEATSYHKITTNMLEDKPLASDYNFEKSQFLVFWDGEVARHLLRTNKVKNYAPIISLHTLARYIDKKANHRKLIDYVKDAFPQKRLQLEIKLRNPNCKVDMLPDLFEYIKNKYMEKYGDNSPRFLSVLSRAKSRKDFEERLAKYVEIRNTIEAKASKSKTNKNKETIDVQPVVTAPAKKVINVTINPTTGSKSSNSTIKVAIVKRK